MPAFRGVDHISLTVTDLDRSERFYTDVLELVKILDVGHARLLLHRQTSFVVGISTPDGADGAPFTELRTGLDHVGFTASSRGELVDWERKFDALGVVYTPIRDMEFGHHLNFRDPDNIALEFMALDEKASSLLARLREHDWSQHEIQTHVTRHLASQVSTSNRR